MVTLRIFLIGLIALVPDRQAGRLTVLLQQARNDEHYPMLIYQRKNLPPQAQCAIPQPLLDENILIKNDDFCVRELEGERIFIRGGEEGDIAFAAGRRHAWYHKVMGEVPGSTDEAVDFSWSPMMEDVLSGVGIIDTKYIYEPQSNDIAAIMKLQGVEGIVDTFGFVDDGENIRSLTFKDSETTTEIWGEKQALADVTRIDLALEGNRVDFVFKELGSNYQYNPTTLFSSGAETTIDVVIGNLPPYLKDPSQPQKSGEHFRLYYKLSAHPPTSQGERIPFVGAAKVDKAAIESCVDIVHYVEHGSSCGSFIASTNRPICTQVVFQVAQ